MRPDRLSHRPGKVFIRAAFATLAILTLSALAYAAVSTKAALDRRAAYAQNMLDRALTSVDDLANRVNGEQDFYLRITPPDPDYILRQPIGLVVFDAKGLPEELTRALVPAVELGCPVYTVTVDEDPISRDLTIYNADGKAVYAIHPYKDYDPYRLLNQLYPDLSTARYAPAYAAWLKGCYDPARVQVIMKLMSTEWVADYAEARYATLADQAAAALGLSAGGGMAMMRSLAADSNIVLAGVTLTSTGAVVQVDHPTNFTGRVDIYWSTDLVAAIWAVGVTNLATNGTGTIYWTDPGATNAAATRRFYGAADGTVDSDGDGIGDGREHFIYHTSETNRDSDGDGLVDGYSGIVSTNAYPGGATTNGGRYVEGEMTWGTNPKLFDTDGDGMGDGWEVSHGHNPLNPNDPPNVCGTVFYSGRQTGTVWVIAVTTSNSWSTNYCKLLTNSAAYQIPNLPGTNYWLKAWIDTNGNRTNNATEAWGACTNNPILVTNQVTGRNITLTDPDNDNGGVGDGLPDWWEIKYFGSTTNYTGADDPDGDKYTNLEEYQANTDPTNITSHPWNISGTIYYTGPQIGKVIVVAYTNQVTLDAVQTVTNSDPGLYTITHLPPGTNYWMRAWRDTDTNGVATAWEAQGNSTSPTELLTTNATGRDVVLADPDNDNDGLPDWWEVKYGLSTAHIDRSQAAGWWALDEASGTNVSDSSIHTNRGTLQNAGTNGLWGTGVLSGALTFDGSDDTVLIPDSDALKPSAVTVALWVRPSRTYTNGTAAFFSKRTTSGTTGYSLGYENGALAFTICWGGALTIRYPCTLTSNAWLHVAGTYEAQTQRLYVNGIQRTVTNYTGALSLGDIDQGTVPARLAATPDATPTNFFAGSLDDVLVFSSGVASNTIHDLYDLGADPDGDGLSNFDEYRAGCIPSNPDTDGDGVLDGSDLDPLNPMLSRLYLNITSPADGTTLGGYE